MIKSAISKTADRSLWTGTGEHREAGRIMLGRRRYAARVSPLGSVATVVVLLLGFAAGAGAQDVQVKVGRGPYYVGDPIEIQVHATGFDDDSEPEIVAGQANAGQLRYGGVSQSSSTSISLINGRVSRVKEVSFVYRFEFIGDKPGNVQIPSFVVTQSGTKRVTNAFRLEVSGVPITGLVGLNVELPAGPIFVGQKVPVEIELRIDREAQEDLLSYRAVVPLFDAPNIRFLDDSSVAADTQLEIETSEGTLRLPATSTEERVGGRVELVVRAQRTMIALVPEAIRTRGSQVVITRGTRFRRDIFNQRTPGASERLMAEGKPVRIEVIEVPREGRPPSFAGAVGEGFTLEVVADRSVVQLGEPILVSFHVRGNGDLSLAGMPPLDAEGLLDPAQFRLPADPPAGLVDGDGKSFEVSLRVLDVEVREIPPVAYSWFDAESRAFETSYSIPIALSVGAAEIIGADDVDRRVGALGEEREERIARRRESENSGLGPVRSTSLEFSGANLAVEQDREKVLGSAAAPSASHLVVPVVYGLALGVLGFAALDYRRRALDPRLLRRTHAFREAKRGIESAAMVSGADAAGALGRALRELVAALPDEADSDYDTLLAECDALRFAPSPTETGLPQELVDRALAFVADRAGTDRGESKGDA